MNSALEPFAQGLKESYPDAYADASLRFVVHPLLPDLVQETRPAINAALLVGHNTLHAGICGYEPRAANPRELREMQQALTRALDEGAIGVCYMYDSRRTRRQIATEVALLMSSQSRSG